MNMDAPTLSNPSRSTENRNCMALNVLRRAAGNNLPGVPRRSRGLHRVDRRSAAGIFPPAARLKKKRLARERAFSKALASTSPALRLRLRLVSQYKPEAQA